MKTRNRTLVKSVFAIVGMALVLMIGVTGKAVSLDQAISLGQFNVDWMVKLCETDSSGAIRPDSEIKKCCDSNTASCSGACDRKYKGDARGDCYDRCGDASRLCYQRAGEKNPGVGPVTPLFPGLRRMFRQQQPNVVAPTQ